MLGQYINVRRVYQFSELIDSYEFNLGALHSDRFKFGSTAHNSEATYSSDRPLYHIVCEHFTQINNFLIGDWGADNVSEHSDK